MANQNYIKLFITTNPIIHGQDVIELTNHNGDTFTSNNEQFNDFISRSEICEHQWIRTTRNKQSVKICCKCRIIK